MPITPRAALAGDRVGLQPGAVGDVHDVHELAGQQVGGVEQVLVHRHRARRSAGRPGSPWPGGSCYFIMVRNIEVLPSRRDTGSARGRAACCRSGGWCRPRPAIRIRAFGPGRVRRRQVARSGVGERQVVDVDPFGGPQLGAWARRPARRRAPYRSTCLRPPRAARSCGAGAGAAARSPSRIAVAAGQGEPVRLPHGLGPPTTSTAT